jgi:hypothetical protein
MHRACLWVSSFVFAVGCGSSNSGSAAGGGGGTGNTTASGGSGNATTGAGGTSGTSGSVQTCIGQIAQAEPYYAIDNGALELGGFVVDSKGMAFVGIPDIVQIVDVSKLDTYTFIVEAGTLDGNVHTIFTPAKGAIPSGVSMDDTSVYFSVSVIGIVGSAEDRGIFSIPRVGGQPTTIYQGSVDSGPVTDGTNFYFLGSTSNGHNAVFQIAKTGGTATTLADRGDAGLSSIAISGTDLYWVEEAGSLATSDFNIEKLSLGSGAPTLFATIPHAQAPNFIIVVGGKAVFANLPDLSNINLYTVGAGQAPVRVAMQAGAPLVASSDGTIFYGSSQGLMRSSIAFDNPTMVPNTQFKSVSGVAIGPSDVWYADHRCIYKTSL